MCKSKNYDEFYNALKMNALPRFNIVYADKEQNLLYIDNGIVPKRTTNFEWSKVVPGNTSKAVWTEFYKQEELPQIKNPDCGYVYNMNNTPYSATCEDGKMPKGDWDDHMNYRTGNNNRSLRFMELIEQKERVNFDDMKRIKFDNQYPKDGNFLQSISVIYKVDANKYPEIKDILVEMQNWNKKANPESIAATYFMVTIDYIFTKCKAGVENFIEGVPLDEALLIEAVTNTKAHLLKYFKTTQVHLKDIQVIRRGGEEYPMPGFPDALAANYAKKRVNDGKFEGFVGDTYTMIVEYDKNGVARLETLANYGASAHPESKHYTDQLKLWIKQQTKVMTLDKETIFKNAERVYKPGN
jgi:acyl-homoserine-lactone acylase